MPIGPPGSRERARPPAVPPAEGGARKGSLLLALGLVVLIVASCSGLVLFLLQMRTGGWRTLGIVAGGAVIVGFLFWVTARKQRMALKRFLGLAPGVKELARRLGVSEADLRGHRPSYREVRIPKKRGGHRVLHVPDDGTKALQRRILRRLLARMKSHDAAFGFEPGRSIAHNAARHVGRAIVLRFDVVDFFPSTRAGRVERMFLRFGWSTEAAALLTRLVTHEGGLPQGAPTSPRLSNLVNVGLDRDLAAWIARRQGRYTRYADDVTVSFPENWIGEPERTMATVAAAFSGRGYRLHGKEKTSVRRRHQRQVVNGLVVNHHVALPRRLRRLLRAARHHAANGRPCSFTPQELEGWNAFESMVRVQGVDVPEPWVRTTQVGSPKRWRP